MNNKRIEFIGQYKNLTKDLGYDFQKLYAANYNCYHKDNVIYIWQKGNVVELSDLKEWSWSMFEFFKGVTLEKPQGYMFNRKTGEISLRKDCKAYIDMITIDTDEVIDFYYENYREVLVSQELIDLINELWDNNLIRIVNK